MKTRSLYLVETVTLQDKVGVHPLYAGSDLSIEPPKQDWVGTHPTLKSALAQVETLRESLQDHLVALWVIEWSSEEQDFFDDQGLPVGSGFYDLFTGSYGMRHCSPGSKIASTPFYIERAFSQSRYATGSGRFSEVKVGDWQELPQLTKDVSVGGGQLGKVQPLPAPVVNQISIWNQIEVLYGTKLTPSTGMEPKCT